MSGRGRLRLEDLAPPAQPRPVLPAALASAVARACAEISDRREAGRCGRAKAAAILTALLLRDGRRDARTVVLERGDTLAYASVSAGIAVQLDAGAGLPGGPMTSVTAYGSLADLFDRVEDPVLEATLAAYAEVSELVHHGGGKPWAETSEATRSAWIASVAAALRTAGGRGAWFAGGAGSAGMGDRDGSKAPG